MVENVLSCLLGRAIAFQKEHATEIGNAILTKNVLIRTIPRTRNPSEIVKKHLKATKGGAGRMNIVMRAKNVLKTNCRVR